eukprot:GAHX01000940.1.p1 GENE.GAHX01000940.1~~GAHX01000940.1.p1  ORF type:complete len:456 (-),score=107.69 GAHX01000940.1:24-1391(-)
MNHTTFNVPFMLSQVIKNKLPQDGIKQLIETMKQSTESCLATFDPLRKYIKSRSSTESFAAIKLLENFLLGSDNFIRLLPSAGKNMLTSLLNIATKQKGIKNFKLNPGKLSKSIEFYAGHIIIGIKKLYEGTRHEFLFTGLERQFIATAPTFIPLEVELEKYIQRNIEVVCLIENIKQVIPSFTDYQSTFSPSSLAENIKLLTEVFQNNPTLRGVELKNNEIVNIVLEKIKIDQKGLIENINKCEDANSRNKFLLLNSNINELIDIYNILANETPMTKNMNIGNATQYQQTQMTPLAQPQQQQQVQQQTPYHEHMQRGPQQIQQPVPQQKQEATDIFDILSNINTGINEVKNTDMFSGDVDEFTNLLNKEREEEEKTLNTMSGFSGGDAYNSFDNQNSDNSSSGLGNAMGGGMDFGFVPENTSFGKSIDTQNKNKGNTSATGKQGGDDAFADLFK